MTENLCGKRRSNLVVGVAHVMDNRPENLGTGVYTGIGGGGEESREPDHSLHSAARRRHCGESGRRMHYGIVI